MMTFAPVSQNLLTGASTGTRFQEINPSVLACIASLPHRRSISIDPSDPLDSVPEGLEP